MKKKVFVTVFPPAENIHLVKDVGMIPYLLHKNHNYDSYVACYNNDIYKYLDTDVVGLKINFIKKRFNNDFVNIMIMLFTFKKIDIIQFYHFSMSKLLICFFFKIMTFGKGKTYIKLDANEKIFEIQYRGLKKILNRVFVKCVDLLSAETQIITDRLNVDNILDKKVEFIPNGFFQEKNTEIFNKRNLFITVGRIGDKNKNNILFLNALKRIDLKDWKVEFIGPIETEFKTTIKQFYEDNSELKEKVYFTGNISDRVTLEKKYADARVFVLTSNSEGFPLVFLEAISNGCYLVSTELIAAKEISNNQEYGSLFRFDDTTGLAKVLEEIIDNKIIMPPPEKITKFANDKYYWPKIVEKIINRLN